MSTTAMKKPIGVYFLAFVFLLAPIGNILLSFAGSGLANWYDPEVFIPLLKTIPATDWVWLGLLFITGILLFKPHKLSWSIALVTLVIVLLINVIRIFQSTDQSIDANYLKVFSILALAITFGVLIIAFYFRFPYLDRRAGFLMNIARYEVSLPLTIQVENKDYIGQTTSLSLSGLAAEMNNKDLELKSGGELALKLEQMNSSLRARVIESKAGVLRLQFTHDQNSKNALYEFIISNIKV